MLWLRCNVNDHFAATTKEKTMHPIFWLLPLGVIMWAALIVFLMEGWYFG
jgi:hypothetical protein